MAKVEMLPIPPEYVDKFWKGVCITALFKIAGYDARRTHQRLLIGLDQLWIAFSPSCSIWGVVLTSVTDRPPSDRKCFERKDPAAMRSLTIHVAGQHCLGQWLDSAIERLTLYARQQQCRQLFLLMRRDWQRHITRRFWAKGWEGVAISRDRPTKSTCQRFKQRNTPGYFRPMVPVKNWTRHMYGFMGTFYFQDEEAA